MHLLVDYVLLNEIMSGTGYRQYLQIGLKQGERIENRFRSDFRCSDKLSVRQFADLSIKFINDLGGKYVTQLQDEGKIIFTCYTCPFGHFSLKVPSLCNILISVLGDIAARNFSHCKVSVQQSIAKRASHCHLVFYLQGTDAAIKADGILFYEYCHLMIEEIDRTNAIITEFLLLTKPATPRFKEIDLHSILEEIFLLIESKSLLENVKLRKCYAKILPPVHVDSAQIKQVFLNLATNAIQAMSSGGHMTISTSIEQNRFVLRFADTGCGMNKTQIMKIFDPFFTTKEQGTGLGLTISQRIIEHHGGRLNVESKPGKGTTFTVELPGIHVL